MGIDAGPLEYVGNEGRGVRPVRMEDAFPQSVHENLKAFLTPDAHGDGGLVAFAVKDHVLWRLPVIPGPDDAKSRSAHRSSTALLCEAIEADPVLEDAELARPSKLDPEDITGLTLQGPVQAVPLIVGARCSIELVRTGRARMQDLGPVSISQDLKLAAASPEHSGGAVQAWPIFIRRHLLEVPIIPRAGNIELADPLPHKLICHGCLGVAGRELLPCHVAPAARDSELHPVRVTWHAKVGRRALRGATGALCQRRS
mmetsp:Transcript_84909/g.203496  ORF Transcript_84909/g.203496 Transcript_84909/m.203496 type:complete len:257 (-) Transcript_84909:448-1218(-)